MFKSFEGQPFFELAVYSTTMTLKLFSYNDLTRAIFTAISTVLLLISF